MADPPPVLTLLVQKGPCKGEARRGRAGAALRVGRVAKGNDLAVRDAGASQSHLSVEFLKPPAARWAVTDLGSSNGTLLNGSPLVPTVPAPLSDGDLIKIGESTVLAVSISADEGPGPAPAATRRSARNAAVAAAVEEEEQCPALAVTRRAGWKKAAAAEAPEAEKELKEEAAVPTRRGGRKKATDPPDVEKEVEEEAAVPTRRGGRKKATEPPDAEKEVEEEAAVPTRRGGRKKVTEPPDAEKEVKEEAAVPTRRGGRKKAVEPPEVDTEEDEKAAVPRRGAPRKAAATRALPPQPQNTRSTRAAARRAQAVGSGNDEGKVDGTGREQARATRASARKAEQAVLEEDEEEGVVPVTRDLVGNPPKATDARGGEEEDAVETRDGTSHTSEEVPVAGRGHAKGNRGGRRKATRASARKAAQAVTEDEEEGEVPVIRDQVGNPPKATGARGGEEEDTVETRGGTSNTSEEVLVPERGCAKGSRGGRRKDTRATATKAKDAIIVDSDENEQEESGVADGRDCMGSPRRLMAANDCDKVATGDTKLDRTSKASKEDEKMVDVEEEDAPLAPKGQTGRATEGSVNVQHATANNDGMEEGKGKDSSRGGESEVNNELRERMLPESKLGVVGEEEENGKREALGGSGQEGLGEEHTGRSSLENMTLGEWFVRIEKYLLAKNEEAAEKAIAEVREKHQCFCEHLKTLNRSSDPS